MYTLELTYIGTGLPIDGQWDTLTDAITEARRRGFCATIYKNGCVIGWHKTIGGYYSA